MKENLEKILLRIFNSEELEGTNRNVKLVVRLLLIVSINYMVFRFFQVLTYQSFSIYEGPFILIEFFKQLATSWKGILLVGPILFFGIFYRERILVRWHEIEKGIALKYMLFCISAVLTWKFAFYDYNLYFDNSHLVDRFVLIGTCLLIFYRPIFVVPFILVLLIIQFQFTALTGYSWAESSLPIAILYLFISFLIINILSRRFILRDFLILLLCVFASHYWLSGFGKMSYDWIAYDKLSYLMPSSFTNGWLSFLKLEHVYTTMSIIDRVNVVLKIMTLLLEFGGLFILFNKKVSRLFFIGWILMHIGIFAITGICFWMWSLTEIIALIFLFGRGKLLNKVQFTRIDLVVGLVLVVSGSYWNRIVKLAWYDTPLAYVYKCEITNDNGDNMVLPNNFFAPYDYQFTLNAFSYLSKKPLLNHTSSGDMMKRLLEIQEDSTLFQFEAEHGVLQFNKSRTEKLENFLIRYIRNWNRLQTKNIGINKFEAPRLYWTFPLDYSDLDIGKIRSVRIVQITAFCSEKDYRILRKDTVLEVDI